MCDYTGIVLIDDNICLKYLNISNNVIILKKISLIKLDIVVTIFNHVEKSLYWYVCLGRITITSCLEIEGVWIKAYSRWFSIESSGW